MPNKNLIVTLISDDKPGIVSQVAVIVAQHKGNWLDSHMVQLAGKFTGLLRIDVAEKNIPALISSLQDLKKVGIETLIEHENSTVLPNSQKMYFELSGPDRTGIVNEISSAFNAANVSIDKIQTHCSSSPWSGEPLFEAKGKLSVPETLSVDALHNALNTIQDALGIDVSLSPENQ